MKARARFSMGLPPGRRIITSQVEPAWVMVPPVKLGDHAGPHQRRLAAARGADDRQESVRSQQLEQSGGLLLAAEEEVVLVAAKRAQAGKRIGQVVVGRCS